MTPFPVSLSHVQPYVGINSITVGNGSQPITHVGSGSISTNPCSLNLNNILCVPNIKKNLLPIKRFTHENNCSFELDSNEFFLRTNRWEKLLALAVVKEGSITYGHPLPLALNSMLVKEPSMVRGMLT